MDAFRPLRAALFLYETARLGFLLGAASQLQPGGAPPFPLLALIAPGALFPLMALFWLLRLRRYREYGPLFLVGKGLSVITALFWIFFANNHMIRELLTGAEGFFVSALALFLVPGDMLSAWLAARILRRQAEV